MIQSMMKDGKLLPSDMVVNLIQRAIEESGNSKILIDGFPRNEENRVAFEQIVWKRAPLLVSIDYFFLCLFFLLLFDVSYHCVLSFSLKLKIEPKFVLFIDCSENDMRKRLLSRNQVRLLTHILQQILFSTLKLHIYFIN